MKSYLIEVPERTIQMNGREIVLSKGWKLGWGFITKDDTPLWLGKDT